MPRRQTYTVCSGCSNWVYDWKLQRTGGWCNKCNDYLSGWSEQPPSAGRSQRGDGKPPWAKQPVTSPADELQHIINKFQLGKGAYATAKAMVDLGPLQALQAQLTAKAPTPAEIPKAKALRQAISNLDQKKAALAKATSQLAEAERCLGVATERHNKALEEAADAEEEHEAVLRAYSSEAIPSQDEASATEWKAPEVDPTLFDNLDDFEPEDKKKLLKFRSDLSSLAKLLESAQKQYTEFTELKKQADAIHASHKAKKRKANTGEEAPAAAPPPATDDDSKATAGSEADKQPSEEEVQQRKDRLERSLLKLKALLLLVAIAFSKVFFSNITQWGPKAHKFINEQGNDMDIIMMCETHLAQDQMKQVKVDVAKDGWKSAGTAAVPTKRSANGTSGGELILVKSHIACSTYDTIRERLQNDGKKDPFYGFTAVNLHTKAGNVVLVTAYWLPGAGLHGPNRERVRALAGFVKALADPWVVLADWNVTFADIAKTGYVQQIGGALVKPDVEVTCDKGKGSLIDYGIARKDFAHKVKLEAVRTVPWRTHCGLTLTLEGSATAWWHRKMQIPKELATPPRPRKLADPNSKRTRKRQEERQRAEERLEPHLREAFQEQAMIEEAESEKKVKDFYITGGTWTAAVAMASLSGSSSTPSASQIILFGGSQGRAPPPASSAWPLLASVEPPEAVGPPSMEDNGVLAFPAAWPAASQRTSCWHLSKELQSWDDKLIIRDVRHREAEAAATRMYGDWVTCLEEAAILTDEIDEEEAEHYRGRASGFEVKWVKARSTPGRTHMKFGPAEQWGILNAILIRYQALYTNGTDGRQQAKCLVEAKAQGKVLQQMDQSQVFGRKHGAAQQQMFYDILDDLADLDEGQLGNLVMQAEGHLATAQARGFTAQQKNFTA
ncbi:unnamed protein product, partial [Prorocentrum cordatum]